jgi:hypothetical protein
MVTLVPPPDPIVFTVRLPALLKILGVQPVRGRRKLVTNRGPPTHRTTRVFFNNEGISPLFLNTRPSEKSSPERNHPRKNTQDAML